MSKTPVKQKLYETYELQGYMIELFYFRSPSDSWWEWRVCDPIKVLHETQAHYQNPASALSDAFALIAGNYEPDVLDDEQLGSSQLDTIDGFLG